MNGVKLPSVYHICIKMSLSSDNAILWRSRSTRWHHLNWYFNMGKVPFIYTLYTAQTIGSRLNYKLQSAVLDKRSDAVSAVLHLVTSEDAVGAELLDGLPWNLDLKGSQCCGINAWWSHCRLCEETDRDQEVRMCTKCDCLNIPLTEVLTVMVFVTVSEFLKEPTEVRPRTVVVNSRWRSASNASLEILQRNCKFSVGLLETQCLILFAAKN